VAPVECAIRKLTGNAGENRGLNDLDASFVGIVGLEVVIAALFFFFCFNHHTTNAAATAPKLDTFAMILGKSRLWYHPRSSRGTEYPL
jgi:hypothetical protein